MCGSTGSTSEPGSARSSAQHVAGAARRALAPRPATDSADHGTGWATVTSWSSPAAGPGCRCVIANLARAVGAARLAPAAPGRQSNRSPCSARLSTLAPRRADALVEG